jgi:hypothetical protein
MAKVENPPQHQPQLFRSIAKGRSLQSKKGRAGTIISDHHRRESWRSKSDCIEPNNYMAHSESVRVGLDRQQLHRGIGRETSARLRGRVSGRRHGSSRRSGRRSDRGGGNRHGVRFVRFSVLLLECEWRHERQSQLPVNSRFVAVSTGMVDRKAFDIAHIESARNSALCDRFQIRTHFGFCPLHICLHRAAEQRARVAEET